MRRFPIASLLVLLGVSNVEGATQVFYSVGTSRSTLTDFPCFDSLAESLVKAEGKGAMAAFSPSGLSLNEPAHRFHQALLDELLHEGHERLGDAVLAAQERYASTGAFPELLSIYHLLGNPAMTMR